MKSEFIAGARRVGDGQRVFIVAEIGMNLNGELQLAKSLIDAASAAGCDAVKFQKRNPEKCVPSAQRDIPRDTPWGRMSYLEYRRRLEFGYDSYREIDTYCRARSVPWFASCWDEDSVEFISDFCPPCYKVPSACLTSARLLSSMRRKGRPVILSTGMSTMDQVDRAVSILGSDDLILLQCTSAYPAKPEEVNLRVLSTYRERFGCLVGYSGHELGTSITLAAVAFGACYIERHITLSRRMWGTDQASSLEPEQFGQLVRDIRALEVAIGDGVKRVYASERSPLVRLRGATHAHS